MAQKTFEKALQELEEIVELLDSGELPLEKSLKKFEEGMKLAKFCSKKLDEIEKKVVILTRSENGEIEEAPFKHESGE